MKNIQNFCVVANSYDGLSTGEQRWRVVVASRDVFPIVRFARWFASARASGAPLIHGVKRGKPQPATLAFRCATILDRRALAASPWPSLKSRSIFKTYGLSFL